MIYNTLRGGDFSSFSTLIDMNTSRSGCLTEHPSDSIFMSWSLTITNLTRIS